MESPTHEPFLYQASPAYDRLAERGHWGTIDSMHPVAPGIVFVSTPSHGGYILNINRYNEMKHELRHASWTNDQCFEEDCSWCAIVLMWPEYFSETTFDAAVMTWNKVYAAKHGTLSCIFPDRF